MRHVAECARESEREGEREREDVVTLIIYNTIQKANAGVVDATLWKGPRMSALKLAAAASQEIIKAQKAAEKGAP